jgi:hypothetical protein
MTEANDHVLRQAKAQGRPSDVLNHVAGMLSVLEGQLEDIARVPPLRHPSDDDIVRGFRLSIRRAGEVALEVHMDVAGTDRWYLDVCRKLRHEAVRVLGEPDGPALVPIPWESNLSTRRDAR